MSAEQIALVVKTPMLRHRIGMIARKVGLDVIQFRSPAALNLKEPPTVIVLELEMHGAIDAINDWKARWPTCFIAAAIAIPNQERWIAASAAGADLVANRGAIPHQLQQKLEDRQKGVSLIPKGTRLQAKRVTNPGEGSTLPADGLVGRVPDAPDGVITIFRVGDVLCAIRDVCPHAGYSLADGELEGTIITCPQHGSRFDVCTGARVRGPSDYPVQTYKAYDTGDKLYVEV